MCPDIAKCPERDKVVPNENPWVEAALRIRTRKQNWQLIGMQRKAQISKTVYFLV
jgi:hypothetical protein